MVELMRTGGYSGQGDLNRILGQSKMANITSLVVKLIDDSFLDENGRIKNNLKFNINNPTFKIQNSKFLKNPDDKYETMLFLPEGEDRKGEGGLRTKGYFKFSYKKVDDKWYICDFYGNIIKEAPENIQQKIKNYINSLDENQNINDLPLITVITVVFNGAKTLEETIQSVINQTYPNVEYIIIDGGSTDGTLDIIKKYEDHIDYWVSEKDKGIYDAMNKGASMALGSWLYFLGSDDKVFDTNVFCSLIKEIEPNLDILMGLVKTNNKFIHSKFTMKTYLHNTVHHQSALYNKTLFKFFRYNTNYKIASDYELNLLILLERKKTKMVKTIFAECKSDGVSNLNWELSHYEMKMIRRKYFNKITNLFLDYLLEIKLFIHRKLKEMLCLI